MSTSGFLIILTSYAEPLLDELILWKLLLVCWRQTKIEQKFSNILLSKNGQIQAEKSKNACLCMKVLHCIFHFFVIANSSSDLRWYHNPSWQFPLRSSCCRSTGSEKKMQNVKCKTFWQLNSRIFSFFPATQAS